MNIHPVRALAHEQAAQRPGSRVPGLGAAILIAIVATVAGQEVPLVGAPVIGIVVGVLFAVLLRSQARLGPGIDVAKGFILQLAVMVLGTQLSLRQVVHVGVGSLPVMVGTLVGCLGAAYLLGRWMGIGADLRTLIGVGTAVCGASAIAAVSPVIRARSERIAYAISTIFLFNVAAVLIFPPLGRALELSQHDFGLFAGTAVNDMSSVVATASTYGPGAANYAVVVKLTRTLMIIPICLALATLAQWHAARAAAGTADERAARVSPLRLVPWFLVGFLVAAAANTAGLVPAASRGAFTHLSLFLITTALAAIGLSTNVRELRRAGIRPVVLGLVLWIIVATTSLLLQWATR